MPDWILWPGGLAVQRPGCRVCPQPGTDSANASRPRMSRLCPPPNRRTKHPHHAPSNPPERLRHELCRPHPAGLVDPPTRPVHPLPRHPLLDRVGADPGDSAVRRPVPGRRGRCVRRLRWQRRCGNPVRRAGARQRPDVVDPGDGRGHRAPGFWRHGQPDLRGALPVCAPHVHAGPPDARPGRLEHRHRLSRQRGAGGGLCPATGARRPLRPGRRVHGAGLPALATQLGGGRRARRPHNRHLRRPRPCARGAPPRQAVQSGRDPPQRAVAAAHARAVPGWLVTPRPAFCRQPCRVCVPERPERGRRQGHRGRHPRAGGGRRPGAGRHPDVPGRHRGHRRDRRRGARQV